MKLNPKLTLFFKENFDFVISILIILISATYYYKFGFGKSINVFLFMASSIALILSLNHGLTFLLISFSTFTLGVFFSVVTFGITIYYQVSFLALLILATIIFRKRKELRFMPKFDKRLLLFYAGVIVYYASLGIMKGADKRQIVKEIFLFGLWLLPLVIPYFLNKNSAKYILRTITFITLFISFLYLRADFLHIYNFEDNRVYTRHVFIYIYTIPYLFTWFMVDKKIRKFMGFVLFIAVWGVLITHTRTVLLTVFIGFASAFLLEKGSSVRRVVTLFIIGLVVYILFINFFPNEIIRERIASFSQFYKDNSFLMRFVATYDVVSQHGTELIKGLGFANVFNLHGNPLYNALQAHWVDIGYLSIIGKTGFIGLITILTIFFTSWHRALKQFIKGEYDNTYHKVAVMGTVAVLPPVLLVNFLAPIMIRYIYLIILVMLISLPQYYTIQEQKKIIREKKKSYNDI